MLGKEEKKRMLDKEEIRRQCTEKGICEIGVALVEKAKTDSDFIRYYKQQITGCLKAGFPDLRFMRKHRKMLSKNGIYVDAHFDCDVLRSMQTYVFYNCTGIIQVEMDTERCIIPNLYFAGGCDITVVCSQDNVMPISVSLSVFGEDKVKCYDSTGAHFFKYNYPAACADVTEAVTE